VPGHGDEEGSSTRGTSTHQGAGSERGGEHEQFARRYADRAHP